MTISSDVVTQIWQTALIVVVGVVVWIVVRWLIHRWSARLQSSLAATGELVDRARAKRINTIGRTLSALVFIIAAVVVVVTSLGVWGVPLGPLIASLSVVGLAIGIGAQDLVKDVIAGMFVLVEDQYAVGDVVELAGASGTVEERSVSARRCFETWMEVFTTCRTVRSVSRRTSPTSTAAWSSTSRSRTKGRWTGRWT